MRKKNNQKIKRYRNIFLNLIKSLPHLFTKKDIVSYFKRKKINIDRTTIYRNIKRLENEKLIFEFSYEKNNTIYEKNENFDHHHHFVCQKCLKSFSFYDEEIEKNILNLTFKFTKEKNVKIISHNFMLKGYCFKCKNNL